MNLFLDTLACKISITGRLPLLCSFDCAYHPAALGSNPENTTYTFSIRITEFGIRKRLKYGEKRPVLAHIKKLISQIYLKDEKDQQSMLFNILRRNQDLPKTSKLSTVDSKALISIKMLNISTNILKNYGFLQPNL